MTAILYGLVSWKCYFWTLAVFHPSSSLDTSM